MQAQVYETHLSLQGFFEVLRNRLSLFRCFGRLHTAKYVLPYALPVQGCLLPAKSPAACVPAQVCNTLTNAKTKYLFLHKDPLFQKIFPKIHQNCADWFFPEAFQYMYFAKADSRHCKCFFPPLCADLFPLWTLPEYLHRISQ